MITRYTLVYDNLQDDDAGEWVKHSDHEAALKAAVAAVRKCVLVIEHAPATREGMVELIKAEFPEAFK